MPIPGLEDLLLPTPTGRVRPRQQEAGSPALPVPPSPSADPAILQFSPRCPKPRCRKFPVKGGLGAASADPVADLPLASFTLVGPVAGVCPQVLPMGKPGLTPGGCVTTLKDGPAQGWVRLQGAPGGQLGSHTECDLWPCHGQCFGTWLVLGSCAWK